MITVANSFVATAAAIAYVPPSIVDMEKFKHKQEFRKAITKKTKAIMPVICRKGNEMFSINKIAKKYNQV